MTSDQVKMIPISKPSIGLEEEQAVLEVLRSGILAQGARVKDLENVFAQYIGVKHAIATNSGTSALYVALLAHGIGEGDEVITTSFTFIASVNSILYTGATPRLVDVDESFNLDPAQLEGAITSRTKAIMPVHLYGQPCAMDAIMDIARRHDLIVVEDACQAHGAQFGGRRVGSFGTGCFSFYATKNMTTGEGGMITTDDDDIMEQARLLISHGMKVRYYHDTLGYNFRMTDVAAGIGLAQFRRLQDSNAHRVSNAAYYDHALEDVPGIVLPHVLPSRTHVYHQYTLQILPSFPCSRDDFVKHLNARGIGTGIYYPVPAHRQKSVRHYDWARVDLARTEKFTQQVVSLPVHPLVSEPDLAYIVETIQTLADS
jgi:dTDP-4-amino-4,6-dideoxygalactose transaminase